MLPTNFRSIWPSCVRVIDQSKKKNCLWWPCLLTEGTKLAIFIRGLSIDASYQVSDHLAMQFQRRFLEIDQSETRIACGGHVC
jgi:hypothetical protein